MDEVSNRAAVPGAGHAELLTKPSFGCGNSKDFDLYALLPAQWGCIVRLRGGLDRDDVGWLRDAAMLLEARVREFSQAEEDTGMYESSGREAVCVTGREGSTEHDRIIPKLPRNHNFPGSQRATQFVGSALQPLGSGSTVRLVEVDYRPGGRANVMPLIAVASPAWFSFQTLSSTRPVSFSAYFLTTLP